MAAPLLFAGRELTKVAEFAFTMFGTVRLPNAKITLKTLPMVLKAPDDPGIVTFASSLF
jgi:hypothetical protein